MHKIIFLALCLALSAAPALAVTEIELESLARKEGKLQLGSNKLAYPYVLIGAFKKKYPWLKISHHAFDAVIRREVTINFFENEKAEDRVDVMLRCQDRDLLEWTENGWLADLDAMGLPNWNNRPRIAEDDKRYVYFLGAPHVVFYNPAKMKEEDLPKSFDELTEPKWKGKVAFRNPWRGNAGSFLAHYIKDTRGNLDWYKKMGDNKAFVAFTGYSVHEAVNSGKYAVGLSRDVEVLAYAHDRNFLKKPKSKLSWKFLANERPFQYQLAAISKTAPNPNTAKLFFNWLLSAEATDVLANAGYSVGHVQAEYKKNAKVWDWKIDKIKRMSDALSVISEATRHLRNHGAVMEGSDTKGKRRQPTVVSTEE